MPHNQDTVARVHDHERLHCIAIKLGSFSTVYMLKTLKILIQGNKCISVTVQLMSSDDFMYIFVSCKVLVYLEHSHWVWVMITATCTGALLYCGTVDVRNFEHMQDKVIAFVYVAYCYIAYIYLRAVILLHVLILFCGCSSIYI